MGSIDYPLNPISVALSAEATFVARTQDTNTKHLSAVLKRAAEHKGAAFVEIYQNCVVLNPTAWEHTTNIDIRDENIVFLEEGEPLVFGKDRDKGIRMNGTEPEVVSLGSNVHNDELVVHHESRENASYAYMLSRMEYPEMPLPFGVLRAVDKPSYTEMMLDQVDAAINTKGTGDLKSLFNTGDTWIVE
jgi:2-oxoglutarate ferredoxin oxidoreductase subunit beta